MVKLRIYELLVSLTGVVVVVVDVARGVVVVVVVVVVVLVTVFCSCPSYRTRCGRVAMKKLYRF